MAKDTKPRIIVYTDRTGAVYERNSQGGGRILDGSNPISVGKIGYFSIPTITESAEAFMARKGKKPELSDIAENLFFSTPLGDVPGGVIIFFNPQTRRYERSHTVTDVQVRLQS